MSELHHPIQSLREGHWFKLICGASFQHLPSVRSLATAYAWVGADCVDVAADPAVVAAARAGIEAARSPRQAQGLDQPLLMVSLNDGEDPHFRKAQFDPQHCPSDCPRPCEAVCPAQAIVFPPPGSLTHSDSPSSSALPAGVIDSRCYGCGRCIPVCPLNLISARSSVSSPETVMAMMIEAGVDAVEIHTQMGREQDFARLWRSLAPWVSQLKLVAVSCPDGDRHCPDAYSNYLEAVYHLMDPKPRTLVWQTDGRPMSGDIGAGTTHAAIQLAQKFAQNLAQKSAQKSAQTDPKHLPGFIQLAGGTNLYTVPKLRSLKLLASTQAASSVAHSRLEPAVAGVAYGSFARSHLIPILDELESRTGNLEDHADLLEQSLAKAAELIKPLKPAARAGPWANASVSAPLSQQPARARLQNSLPALS